MAVNDYATTTPPVPSNKSLLTLNKVDVKPVVLELRRIAEALEAIVFNAYGYHMKPPVADRSGPEPTVDYTDDTSIVARVLADAKHLPDPADTPLGEETEEDGA